MTLRSNTLERWWPSTQALDLVEGSLEVVAEALQTELKRIMSNEQVTTNWKVFPGLDSAFRAAKLFTDYPTLWLVLPTVSKWTALWNNSFLCDGHDSLCWCLTKNHGLRTLHWSAHDKWTTFQSGASFTHRILNDETLVERFVWVAQEDARWLFHESGLPLPEEDLTLYTARRKSERLNEQRVAELLERLEARPWAEDFYAIPHQSCFVVERKNPPRTITRREPRRVIPNL